MPKSLTPFLVPNKNEERHWDFPTFQATVNVLNVTVLQEILKVQGVQLVHLEPIIRPPTLEDAVEAVAQVVKTAKKPKKKDWAPTKASPRFKHPSGQPASHFILRFMFDNGGSAGIAELKRFLKTQGFEPGTAQGAISKLMHRAKIKRAHPSGYKLEPDTIEDFQRGVIETP